MGRLKDSLKQIVRRIYPTKNMTAPGSSPCGIITDDEVELYVLRHPQNADVVQHLGSCPNCASRIAKSREYVALMKAALKECRQPSRN